LISTNNKNIKRKVVVVHSLREILLFYPCSQPDRRFRETVDEIKTQFNKTSERWN